MSDTDGTTGTATPAPSGAVALASPSPPVAIPPSSTVLPSDTKYREQYDGLRGAFKAARTQWDETRGGLEEQLRSTKSELELLRQQSTQLTTQNTTFQEQLTALPGLQERAGLAEAMELQLERMEIIMRHPQIIARTAVVTVGEGDTAHEERQNPFMDMLLSSTVSGDDFLAMVNQIAGQLNVPAATPITTSPVTAASAPPPTPAPGDETIESLLKQANALSLEGKYDEVNAIYDKVSVLRSKA